LGSFLQIRHAKCAYRLNDIRSYGSKWHVHPRFTFINKNSIQGTIMRKLA
jgi:hypothetical protein